jgi:bacillithiol system protein YtxJ
MTWEYLESSDDLNNAITASESQPVAIFKHSTRCSVSMFAKRMIEGEWDREDVRPYFLDLLSHRDISDEIAERFGVQHESPQLLILRDRKVLKVANHSDVSVEAIPVSV